MPELTCCKTAISHDLWFALFVKSEASLRQRTTFQHLSSNVLSGMIRESLDQCTSPPQVLVGQSSPGYSMNRAMAKLPVVLQTPYTAEGPLPTVYEMDCHCSSSSLVE